MLACGEEKLSERAMLVCSLARSVQGGAIYPPSGRARSYHYFSYMRRLRRNDDDGADDDPVIGPTVA